MEGIIKRHSKGIKVWLNLQEERGGVPHRSNTEYDTEHGYTVKESETYSSVFSTRGLGGLEGRGREESKRVWWKVGALIGT